MHEEESGSPSTRNRARDVDGNVIQVGTVHGPIRLGALTGRQVLGAVAVLVVVAAGIVAVLVTTAKPVVNNNSNNLVVPGTPERVPESVVGVQGRDRLGSCNTFYFSEKNTPAAMATMKAADLMDRADGRTELEIEITAQVTGDDAVLVTGLRVVEFSALPPPTTGVLLTPLCGGTPVPPRNFRADLDKLNPTVTPTAREPQEGDPPAPAVPFPFKVFDKEPEVFNLVPVRTQPCDCRFAVEVDWVAHGRRGSSRVDNNGAGFRLVVGSTVPSYGQEPPVTTWIRK